MTYYSKLEDMLTSKGIEYVDKGPEYLVRCINPEHNDNNPSMRINKSTGAYYCFSCGYSGNLIKETSKIYSSPVISSLKYEILGYLDDMNSKNVEVPLGAVLFNENYRNIPKEVYNEFNAVTYSGSVLGQSVADRIIFPIDDYAGNIIGFVCRTLIDEEPKFLAVPRKRRFPLFPLKKLKPGPVILVEGLFDMLNLYSKGINNVLCIFGVASASSSSNKVKEQLRDSLKIMKLSGVSSIFSMLDNDQAGRDATERFLNNPVFRGFNRDYIDYSESDPGEITSASTIDSIKQQSDVPYGQ